MEKVTRSNEHGPSKFAVGALALGVIGWDAICPRDETISEGFDRIMEKGPVHKAAFRLGSLAVFLHCTNLIKPKYDPIHQIGKLIRKDK